MDAKHTPSLLDPITQQSYDLTVHIPHILPCCGKTCAITTIHDAQADTDKCPFCIETLSKLDLVVNKDVCQLLSAQSSSTVQPQFGSQKKEIDGVQKTKNITGK